MRHANSKFAYGREKNTRGTIADELVGTVRRHLHLGSRHRDIAAKFGLSMGQVGRISNASAYWWVPEAASEHKEK
jgi:hypothetical protein